MTRKGWTVEKETHDPYLHKEKYSDPSVCESCNVVFTKGMYKWKKVIPENASKIICPACQRIKDNFEGGYLILAGNFLSEHKEEILNLVKHTEQIEKDKKLDADKKLKIRDL